VQLVGLAAGRSGHIVRIACYYKELTPGQAGKDRLWRRAAAKLRQAGQL
jgi:hypothetical protein